MKRLFAYLEVLIRKHKQNIDSFLKEKAADIRFVSESFNYDELSNKDFLQQKF